ncbi:MAG: carbon starvation CstA family protein [Myxococcota bacterium]|nr:carbon starvation CstA family protein [Myxococcota bacterium]
MPAVVPVLACFLLYVLGYRFYSNHLATRIFGLDAQRTTPAHALRDDVDYLPTPAPVLFGHHYASIAGLAPMLGPAVAVIWGWLPAMIWVVVGALLIGCVHDFSALVLSLRARGLSVAVVAEGVVGRRAMTLFHLIIFFGIALAMGVFVFVIAKLFGVWLVPPGENTAGVPGFPQAVGPSAFIMVLALIIGVLVHRKGWALGPLTSAAFVLTLVSIVLSVEQPTLGIDPSYWPSQTTWTFLLMGYALLACVLPVWTLLQPRDFINSLLLYLGLALAYGGFFVLAPSFQAPAIDLHPEGAPSIYPFVFIVIACGAASGFHGLVSSGTTAKQLDNEMHARPIGYGGMIGESLLGLLAVLATTAGMGTRENWDSHYASWQTSSGLAAKIGAFIDGSASFVATLGIPLEVAASFIAIIVVSFALTTLDSATRLLRFNIEELVRTLGLPRVLAGRGVASLLAVFVILGFALFEVNGKPMALALWTLFGTTNQLLAGLTLLLASLYLRQRGRNPWFTGIPMVYMLVTTLIAMGWNLTRFADPASPQHSWLLTGVGGILLILGVWVVVEAFLSLRRVTRIEELDVPLSQVQT